MLRTLLRNKMGNGRDRRDDRDRDRISNDRKSYADFNDRREREIRERERDRSSHKKHKRSHSRDRDNQGRKKHYYGDFGN